VVLVPLESYDSIKNTTSKTGVARVIGRINHALQEENFILIGPYRWGSNNPDLGVKVTYADVHNSKMLIELIPETETKSNEPSYGTHFFQDLVEANIYPLAINPNSANSYFQSSFFTKYKNLLSTICPNDSHYANLIKVYDIQEHNKHHNLQVIMVSSLEESIGFTTNKKTNDIEKST
jgi:hypothetical protein